MYSYTAYGLTISSELSVPELETITFEGAPDATIRLGSVPETLENATGGRGCYQTAPGAFLLRQENVARFLVRDGRSITIDPTGDGGAEHPAIGVFLLGSALGALLQQRGMLVLHGAAVVIGGAAVLLTGRPKAGKSTLAATLNQRGYAVLTDDVCAVSFGGDQKPRVAPGFPSFKLWRDAAEALNADLNGLRPILQDWQKYRVGMRHYQASPVRLDAVYILTQHDEPDLRIEAVTGMNKLNALIKNTYRYRFLGGQALKSLHFRQCAAAASHVKVFRITRPKEGNSVAALADVIEKSAAALAQAR